MVHLINYPKQLHANSLKLLLSLAEIHDIIWSKSSLTSGESAYLLFDSHLDIYKDNYCIKTQEGCAEFAAIWNIGGNNLA